MGRADVDAVDVRVGVDFVVCAVDLRLDLTILDILGSKLLSLVQRRRADGLDHVLGFGVLSGDVEVGYEPG